MSQRQEKIYDELKEIAPTVMLEDQSNDWEAKLKDVAKLFGQEDEAQAWLDDYYAKAEKLGKEIKEALSDKEQIENLKQKMNKKTTVISMQSVVENAINNGITNEQVNKADYLTKQLEQREDGLEGVFKDD